MVPFLVCLHRPLGDRGTIGVSCAVQVNEYPAPVGASVTVAENLALSSIIVASIPSGDPDAGAVATYSFQDGNAGGRCVVLGFGDGEGQGRVGVQFDCS